MYFQNLLSSKNHVIDDSLLECIPSLVSESQNVDICAKPDAEEIKNVVWSLKGNSAPSRDGIT